MQIYSVSEFISGVNEVLTNIPACVQGEISNFRIAQDRFVWFDIKDDSSYMSCFMLKFQLEHELEDGMEIQVFGNPGLFKKSGRFHFRVQRIQLIGEGSLKRQYELLKAKLEKEGLFDPERKRSLPRFPQCIGLVTSIDAAAFTDVKRILKNRWSGLDIIHLPVNVQGDQAASSIVQALQYINAHLAHTLDVVILTRGGGSLEDLQAFNEEAVVRAVFGLKVPSVVAIGHERDETLAEYAADQRASTPSNAAELVVPSKTDVIYQLQSMLQQQEQYLQHTTLELQQRNQAAVYLLASQINNYMDQVQMLQQNFTLHTSSWIQHLQQSKLTIDHATQLLQSYHPKNILKRGYTITTTKTNQVITANTQVKKRDTITTTTANGTIQSTVL